MMHGVVMKITEQCIVVLCEDGTFRNLPHLPDMPQLGDRIPVKTAARSAPARKRHAGSWLRQAWWLAASVLLLVGAVFLWKPATGSASTLVAIDINPSMELYVKQDGRIDRVKPLNDDAKKLLSARKLKGQNFYEAVRVILDEARKQGYLNVDKGRKWIMLSTVELRSAPFLPDKQKVGGAEKGYEMEWFEADRELMDKAKAAELPLNKYIVYQQAKEKGIRLNIKDLRSHSIPDALTGAGIDPQRFFDGAASRTETGPQSDSPKGNTEGQKGTRQDDGRSQENKQPQEPPSLENKDHPVNSAENKDSAARKPGSGKSAESEPADGVKNGGGLKPAGEPQSGKGRAASGEDKSAANGAQAKSKVQGKNGAQAENNIPAKNEKQANGDKQANQGVQRKNGESGANNPANAADQKRETNAPRNP